MRKGFGFHDRHSPFRFNPATMFAGGAIAGAWYDPSNITTLFQDDAGTTPVTAVEQTVGRILDLSGNSNHATQSVAGSRPTLSARVNLLTKTEQFNDAAWTKSNASITPDSTTAPNGTTTADTLIENTANSSHSILQGLPSLAANVVATHSFYVKRASGTRNIRFTLYAGPDGLRATFNLDTLAVTNGSYGTSTYVSGSITAVGNGWYRCVVTGSMGQPAPTYSFDLVNAGAVVYTGDGTSGLFLWGADARVANEGTSIPSYQWVNTATDYDTAGFPLYLRFDGSDDSMLTGSIDFTGTNKMTVFAGVRKLSDAAQGVVAELSATIASNNGAFLLSAPNSAAANYNWSSKGTTQVDNTVTTYAAPNTAVLTGQANIAGPSNIIRVNGAQAGSVATTQGTGNFGNYPLYIGRRNNASLPFNGRLYGLIVLGAVASDWQVYVTEQWMAGKTGLRF